MKITRTTIYLIALFLILTACSHQNNSFMADNNSEASSTLDSSTHPNNRLVQEIQDIKTDALELLSSWKSSNYSSVTAQDLFYDLCLKAESLLGKDHCLSKVLSLTYMNGIFDGSINVIDMAINILSFNKGDPDTAFIGESVYLFDDCRFNYESVYPVYDLSSGLYGVYNTDACQYIYEPTLNYMSDPDANGYICLGNRGYYGCINMQGEKVIGFMYDDPIIFINDFAVMKTNNKYGVINRAGGTVLPAKYGYIKVLDEIIVANNKSGSLGNSEYEEFALFSHNGTQLSAHNYCDIDFYNNRIYAMYREDGDVKLDLQHDNVWYDLYDINGTRLIGEGTSVPEAWGVKKPGENGVMIAICNGKITNEFGFDYPTYHIGGFFEYGYRYITDALEWLNTNAYEAYMSAFNKNGYAVASVYNPDTREKIRVVLNSDGKEVDRFALDDCEWYMPVEANDYIYKMSYYVSGSSKIQYGVLSRSTGRFVVYPSVEIIDGTNLSVVQDNDTGLYGLYDRDNLVLDLVYNEINYYCGEIIAKRGAEEITYTPKRS